MPEPFLYPQQPHIRRHGPVYTAYQSYRPWLRDEFSFRCVYCLKREQWGIVRGTFDVDHFVPQRIAPSRVTDYDNLVYSCASCNAAKRDLVLPDPTQVLVYPSVVVHSDGGIEGRSPAAKTIIGQLDLDGPIYQEYRRLVIDIIALARKYDISLYERLLGFPDALPNLATHLAAGLPRQERPGILRRRRHERSDQGRGGFQFGKTGEVHGCLIRAQV